MALLLGAIAVFGLLAAEASEAGVARSASGGRLTAVATIEVDGTPLRIVATARAVWVAAGLGGLARIDPTTNQTVARIRPGGSVIDVARGFGAVWAVDVFRDRLLRIDPHTNRVVARTRVGGMPSRVAVGHGRVWVASQLESTVSAVDPKTGKVVAVGKFPYGELWPGGLAVGAGGVWVVTGSGNEVTLIDPTTMDIARRIPIIGARTVATTGDALWVGRARSEAVVRIQRGSIAPIRAFARSDGYGPQLAVGSALWLATTGRVLGITADGTVEHRLPVSSGHRLAAVAEAGDLWVADESARSVLRLAVRPRPRSPVLASPDRGQAERALAAAS